MFTPELIKNLLILVWVVVLVQVFNVLRNRFLEQKKINYTLNASSYKARQYFFSYHELEFYRLLCDFLSKSHSGKYDVFPKVRLLDLAETKYKNNFYKIAQKHIDFLVVDQTKHCTPIVWIELNWDSHNTEQMHERDGFVNSFFDIIKIPFVVIQNEELKEIDILTEKLNKFLI